MKTLYYNGNVLTFNGTERAQAVLVQDGRIAAAGAFSELECVDAARRDLRGKTLMPAFIDPHSHFSSAASSMLEVQLGGARSIEELTARISQFIKENDIQPGEWVRAGGYDHNALMEQRHPCAAALDAAAPCNPVVVQHSSGHCGVFNTLAMQKLGFEAPEGYLEETEYMTRLRATPLPSFANLLDGYAKAQRLYTSYGITTLQEGMFTPEMIPLYQGLLQSGILEVDVVAYAMSQSAEKVFAAFPNAFKRYDGHFKLAGRKVFLDGSPQARTAWMREPYQDSETYKSEGTLSDEALDEALNLAESEQVQLLAHCNGDAAAQQFINAVGRQCARAPDFSALRPVMIHAQLLGTDQLPELKKYGIIPSFFPAHVYYFGDVHIKNFGRVRAENISPAKTAQELGIPFTFHQDTPVLPPDMLQTVWCAVNRVTKNGVTLGQDQCLTPYEALKAVTVNAAYQYREEADKGRIAPGMQADIVILDKDPLTVLKSDIRDIRVLETIKAGKTVFTAV